MQRKHPKLDRAADITMNVSTNKQQQNATPEVVTLASALSNASNTTDAATWTWDTYFGTVCERTMAFQLAAQARHLPNSGQKNKNAPQRSAPVVGSPVLTTRHFYLELLGSANVHD